MKQKILEFFYKNKIRKNKLLIDLKQLKNDLEFLGNIPDDDVMLFDYAVKYFNIIVSFQDKCNNVIEKENPCRYVSSELRKIDKWDFYDYFSKIFYKYLKQNKVKMSKDNDLFSCLQKSGRKEFNWVSARIKEPVTLDNLYLDNLFGTRNKTARFFKNICTENCDNNKVYVLRNFLKSNIYSIKSNIDDILKNNKISTNNIIVNAISKKR